MKVDTSKKVNNIVTKETPDLDGDNGFKYLIDDEENLWVYLDDQYIDYSKDVIRNMSYDEQSNSFIRTKPFDSWIFDEDEKHWKAPVDRPDNDNLYFWDEETTSWKLAN